MSDDANGTGKFLIRSGSKNKRFIFLDFVVGLVHSFLEESKFEKVVGVLRFEAFCLKFLSVDIFGSFLPVLGLGDVSRETLMSELRGLGIHQTSRESERAVIGKAVLKSQRVASVVEGKLSGNVVIAVASVESRDRRASSIGRSLLVEFGEH